MQDKPSSITINTVQLRERLNRVYAAMRSAKNWATGPQHFYDLWDLKELALLHDQETVRIPASWLEEVERSSNTVQH